MRLLEIYKQLVEAEQDQFTASLDPNNPDLVEFNKDNFVASMIPAEKRVEFSPINDKKSCNRVRSMINNLRTQFRILKVVQLGMNVFDVRFEPTENFDNVKAFITANPEQTAGQEEEDIE